MKAVHKKSAYHCDLHWHFQILLSTSTMHKMNTQQPNSKRTTSQVLKINYIEKWRCNRNFVIKLPKLHQNLSKWCQICRKQCQALQHNDVIEVKNIGANKGKIQRKLKVCKVINNLYTVYLLHTVWMFVVLELDVIPTRLNFQKINTHRAK